MNMKWKDAIAKVLKEHDGPMHYKAITEEVIRQKLRSRSGKTPEMSANRCITQDLKEGEASAFYRGEKPGEFGLRSAVSVDAVSPRCTKSRARNAETSDDAAVGVIQAFGMFWRRDLVLWNTSAKILAQKEQGSESVDVAGQIGVYMLYDNRDVIYVGRAIDRPLGRRLYEHTYDRLNGRWNRFSWFGLLRLTLGTDLHQPSWTNITTQDLVAAMEALLIEGLEPPQNRKRGDEFKGVEYLQVKDPRLQKRELSALLDDVLKGKLGND